MTAASTTRPQSARRRASAAGDIIPLPPNARQRRGRPRREARPDAQPSAIVPWPGAYAGRASAGYDDAIIMVWTLRDHGAIDDAEAAARDVALRRLRYALGEGREAAP
jgi:hypothetical protein